jgi:hypothetical protein
LLTATILPVCSSTSLRPMPCLSNAAARSGLGRKSWTGSSRSEYRCHKCFAVEQAVSPHRVQRLLSVCMPYVGSFFIPTCKFKKSKPPGLPTACISHPGLHSALVGSVVYHAVQQICSSNKTTNYRINTVANSPFRLSSSACNACQQAYQFCPLPPVTFSAPFHLLLVMHR